MLAGSAHRFANGHANVYQTLLAKPDGGKAGLPLSRADWYVSVGARSESARVIRFSRLGVGGLSSAYSDGLLEGHLPALGVEGRETRLAERRYAGP